MICKTLHDLLKKLIMNEKKYLFEKIKNSLKSKTLTEKVIRFLVNQIKCYILIPLISLFQTSEGLQLDFKEGYKDHRSDKDFVEIKPHQIERIIKAYTLAKLNQKNADSKFQIRGLWEEWISVNYRDLIFALESKNSEILLKLFNNVLREQCTRGLGSYDEWLRYNSFLGKNYLKYVWINYYKKLIDLQGNKKIIFPKVGNPCGIIHNDKIIPIESLRHAYRAEEIVNCLTGLEEKVVVDIGGGYGGLIFQLASKLEKEKNNKFYLFDIPEVAAISSAFLIASFPDKQIRLYGEGSISSDTRDFEIGVFPHFAINELKDNSIDLFYNSCSFSEMDEVSSTRYLFEIERCCRKYLMHDNHETNLIFRENDGTFSKNIIGSKLIPNKNNFELIYKKKQGHKLPDDSFFKSFRYLYKKI